MKFSTVCIALLALPLCFSLSACEKEKPAKSAEWWQSHPAERAAKLAECKSNPGELQRTAECINAQAGENEAIRVESLKEETEKTPEEKATEEKATEEKAPEEKATEEKAPEEKATEEKAPEEKATEEKAPEEKSKNGQ